MFGPDLIKAFVEFKSIWDPDNKMNPNKVVNAYLPTENLRLGADYKPLDPKTYFQFPDDGGSFAKAAVRCIGLGECRKHDSGTMCPSYMVTLEEEHSTRGRAHNALRSPCRERSCMTHGRTSTLRRRLDLCPLLQGLQIGMPDQRGRCYVQSRVFGPLLRGQETALLHAYAFGMIDRWAQLGSIAPVRRQFF